MRPRPNGLHDVLFPSAKAHYFEQVGYCVNDPGSDVWKHDIGQTFLFATSTVLFDGSVARRRRQDGLPSVFSMPFDSTIDGVRGRDIP